MNAPRSASLLARFYQHSYHRNLGVWLSTTSLEANLHNLPSIGDSDSKRVDVPNIDNSVLRAYRAAQATQARARAIRDCVLLDHLTARTDGLSVLDFGCGETVASYVRDIFPMKLMVGVDTVFDASQDHCVADGAYRVPTLHDAEQICTRYDLIVASFVLHHLPTSDLEGVLASFWRTLAEGGMVLLIEDDPDSSEVMPSEFDQVYAALTPSERHKTLTMNDYWSNVIMYGRSADDHYGNYKTTSEWQDLAQSVGFTVTTSRRLGFDLERLHGVPSLQLVFTQPNDPSRR